MFQIPEPARYLATSFNSLDATFNYHSWRDLLLDIDLKGMDLSMGSSSMVEDTSLSARVSLKHNHLQVEDLKVAGERVHATGAVSGDLATSEGKKPILTGIGFALSSTVRADISLLGSYLDLGDSHGMIEGDTKITAYIPFVGGGRPASFAVSGNGKSHDARPVWHAAFRQHCELRIR